MVVVSETTTRQLNVPRTPKQGALSFFLKHSVMKQKRTAQQEVDALRVVVIRQRTLLNRKCKEFEVINSLYHSADRMQQTSSKLYEESAKQRENLARQVENLKEKATDHYVRMRMAIAFMLSAIQNGYKFQDEETERLFYELCDSSGVSEQDREEFAQMQAQASK